jgi:hypothetical protein
MLCADTAKAQRSGGVKDTSAPYLHSPGLPAFDVLLTDSITTFNTSGIPGGKPVVFIMFSPDCDHCEQLTRGLLNSLDRFRSVRICLLSPMPLYQIRAFAEHMQLSNYRQLMVGQDKDYFFGYFFHASTVPFIAIYNADRQLVRVLDQPRTIDALLKAMNL